jgi:hypothetical protein
MSGKLWKLILVNANLVATPVIPELRRLRQEDHEFKASLGCTGCLKEKN